MHLNGQLLKTVKMTFEGEKTCRKLANGQDIDYSENNGPRASSAPLLRLFSIIFKHVYRYIQQSSGERLQDHCSFDHENDYHHHHLVTLIHHGAENITS